MVARPRTLLGKISEINTHVTGANVNAYTPIAESKNHDTAGERMPSICEMIKYKIASDPAPNNISGLWPSLSTNRMARIVNARFTAPINTVCNS